jgi:glucose/arabinose dehydrogenase
VKKVLLFWLIATRLVAQPPTLQLKPYASGLFHPVDIAAFNPTTLLVGQANGQVRLVENGVMNPTPYLDIGNLTQDTDYNGIFGICLHPDFATNGYLYVQYFRQTDKAAVIARYTRSATNSNQADPASAQIVFVVPYPGYGHRSGRLAFGPDGYLYITTGDSAPGARGGVGDPDGFAQNPQSPFGKLFRIDVNNGSPYAIPPTNPFADPNDGVPDALYASGLRNPWRWSFDRLTGDLWLADVGQDGWEELNYTPANTLAPQNYGWRCFEGTQPYVTTGCSNTATFAMPILTYPGYDNNGQQQVSITGGFVYRGNRYRALQGWYVYGDWSQGKLWTLRRNPANGRYENVLQTATLSNLVSFGEGTDGELYALSFFAGTIHRIGTDAIASVQSGNWHNPSTWDCGCVPTSATDVVIDTGHVVTVGQPASLRSLVLQGTLRFENGGSIQYP